MDNRTLRVCYFGTYRQNYSRNQIMIAGLRLNGVEVIECHETLWHGTEDRVDILTGGWKHPAFWWRVLRAYIRLFFRYWVTVDFDVLVVGYPGQFDVFLARLLAWLRGKPLVWDVFMSIYLIALERNLDAQAHFTTRLLRCVEWLALRLPDRMIQDTASYLHWLVSTYKVDSRKFSVIPTGADDRVFRPQTSPEAASPDFRVIYYGTFIPNHGVEYIIEAARLLSTKGVQFELVGKGPEHPNACRLMESYALTNVTMIDWLDKPDLIKRISRAQIVLGAFGKTPQSLMTVQNKIYEGFAMTRAVVSGDSEAIRQEFHHGEHIFLCERANGLALAEAILTLKQNPALITHLAHNGFHMYQEKYCLQVNGQRFAHFLREMVHK